jgi:hypothetical protein
MLEPKELIHLFPYSLGAKLDTVSLKLRILNLTEFLLTSLHDSLYQFFIRNDLSYFDPHVGENLCQIRACYLLELQKNTKLNSRAQEEVMIELAQVKAMILRVKKIAQDAQAYPTLQNSFFGEWMSLNDFLNHLKVNINLSSHFVFLLVSFILTKYRGINAYEDMIIDYPLLMQAVPASKNLCRRLIHLHQKCLSLLSINYVSKMEANQVHKEVLYLLSHKDDDGRSVLPCYTVTHYLIKKLIAWPMPILLLVRSAARILPTLSLLFICREGRYYLEQKPLDMSANNACFVVYAATQASLATPEERSRYQSTYYCHGIESILMASMAVHPQYSGKKLGALKEDPYYPLLSCSKPSISKAIKKTQARYIRDKSLAYDLGCSASSPSLLNIRHISAGYINQHEYYCQRELEAMPAIERLVMCE